MSFTPPKVIDGREACRRLQHGARPGGGECFAFYSTWLDGIITEPWLAMVPLDDHLVHRGDGVFEVSKCVAGRIYQFERHLQRLARSAESIRLDLPLAPSELREIAVSVVRAGGHADCMVRIYLSRGPGGFTTNPFECPTPGLYVAAGPLHPLPEQAYQRGVNVGISQVPSKSGFYASVKSCNYLPNVLLKREAVARGWDFAVGLDENGHIAEGSTENIGLVDLEGRLVVPQPHHILEGITVRRAQELAAQMAREGLLASVEHATISAEDLAAAREVMLFGTTLDVLPVTALEGRPLGGGEPGPVAAELLRRMRRDILDNPDMSTPALS